jgi:conjugal transfer pilus assembly protein TraI
VPTPSDLDTRSAGEIGLSAIPVDSLVSRHAELIQRIRVCFGLDRETFDRDVMTIVRRYAAYVHLVPATADSYFKAPGGLLQLGLETAFFSLQGSDAHIFSGRATITARRHLEPRWRHATFIGGLACALHRIFSHVHVQDSAGHQWPAYLEPLAIWLADNQCERYFIRWRADPTEAHALALFAVPFVVPPSLLQWLALDNDTVVPHLLASISGMRTQREHNVLDSLVRRSMALVIDRHLRAQSGRHGATAPGQHIEHYLVDAMQRLILGDSAWSPNAEKSRVWFGQDGLFLLWPQAARDMQELLEGDQVAGIPKTAPAILELLLGARVLEPRDSGEALWLVLPPGASAPVDAVKVTIPEVLISGLSPRPLPLSTWLVHRAPTKAQETEAAPPSRGKQLSLLEPDRSPTVAAAPAGAPPLPKASAARAAELRLNAPMRLHNGVRRALETMLVTPIGRAVWMPLPGGLFVPLQEFETRGVQSTTALRALDEVQMLAAKMHEGAIPVEQRVRSGESVLGLVIDARFVDGLGELPLEAGRAEG